MIAAGDRSTVAVKDLLIPMNMPVMASTKRARHRQRNDGGKIAAPFVNQGGKR